LTISQKEIDAAGYENFNSIYLSFIKAYNDSVDKHRITNKKKADRLDYAYKLLIVYAVFTLITVMFIAISFFFNI
ncbi:hypothetical protein AAIR29_08320, partial [Psychrobacter sp. FBL11]